MEFYHHQCVKLKKTVQKRATWFCNPCKAEAKSNIDQTVQDEVDDDDGPEEEWTSCTSCILLYYCYCRFLCVTYPRELRGFLWETFMHYFISFVGTPFIFHKNYITQIWACEDFKIKGKMCKFGADPTSFGKILIWKMSRVILIKKILIKRNGVILIAHIFEM